MRSGKTIACETVVAFIPGVKAKVYEHLIFLDKNHWKIENRRRQAKKMARLERDIAF